MYFDFDDYRPDTPRVMTAISWREGVLLSIIFHLVLVITLILSPKLFSMSDAARARALALAEQRQQDNAQFVFVQPRLDTPAPKPPDRGVSSDKDRIARAPEQAPKPENEKLARGNTPKPSGRAVAGRARRSLPTRPPASGAERAAAASSQSALTPPPPPDKTDGANGRAAASGGSLGDALKNASATCGRPTTRRAGRSNAARFNSTAKASSWSVDSPLRGAGEAELVRPAIVMSNHGHVVIQFNVHRDGKITDLVIVGPCPIAAFNNAAFGALASSNPTQPLPPAYPADKAFFTVTFFYNESPQ
jgi:TonB family protein